MEIRPATVRLGESAALTVMVEAPVRPPQPRAPSGPDFLLVPRQYAESENNVQGEVTYQSAIGFELRPTRQGVVDIPPFEVEMGGVTYRSQPLQITVLEGEAPVPEEGPHGPPVFVTAEVDRREVWLGEPVLWTFRFFHNVRLQGQPDYTPPALPNFLMVDRPLREVSESRDGGDYRGTELRLFLFPQTAGTFTIGSPSVRLSMSAFDPYDLATHREFFERLFSGRHSGTLVTPEFEVRVKPLPTQGRPPEFRGAVGDLQATASLDREEARVGEPVTLQVRISGEGNLGLLDPPALPALPAFRVHETRSSGGLDPDGDRPTGARTFTTVLEPRSPGEHRIAGMRFAWFDPEAGRYRTAALPDLKVRVTGTALPLASPTPSAAKPGLRQPRLPPSLWQPLPPGSPWILALPLVALGLVLGWPAPRRRVLRGVEAARAALDAGESPSAVLGAWLEERLGPRARALSRGDLRAQLGLSAEAWQALDRLLEDLDAVRFAPAELAGREEARHGPAVLALVARLEGESR